MLTCQYPLSMNILVVDIILLVYYPKVMVDVVKGIIFGKINKGKISKPSFSPTSETPRIITARVTNPNDPNHEREILRKHAIIARKIVN